MLHFNLNRFIRVTLILGTVAAFGISYYLHIVKGVILWL